MDISDIIQLSIAIITLISVILIYRTIKSNQILNKKIIFNEIVKQERELRVKLNEYRKGIHKEKEGSIKHVELTLDYDTLLFNYYEYLAICLFKGSIDENEAKLYFKDLLIEVKKQFEESILFKEEIARKEQYPGIQWLFKKWKV